MVFTPVDQAAWPRAQMYYYFSQMAPTGYSMTVDVDVTHLYEAVHRMGVKFFPAYLWLVTKAIAAVPELRTAVKDGAVGYWDVLTPLYPVMHEDGNISLMWTEYDPSFEAFFAAYLENAEQHKDVRGVLGRPGLPPENAYTVSCIPWVGFKHFAIHSYDNKPYYFPSIEAGKYRTENGKRLMPLSVTCHHATTDGLHVARFLEELQHGMDTFGA
ncbi:MAG: chloramphenicol acetyltransferase [Clostridia bacterium]|nr:chloramphenicol acetyltransferase [Clostridia bacterium]